MADNETYTVVDFGTLKPYFPEERANGIDTITRPVMPPLKQRSAAEIELLAHHPFFKLS